MPFQQQGDEPLSAVVNIRLTEAEKAQLQEDADLASLSVSALVRRRYFGRPIIANTDAIVLKELRRLGGLLKHIHNETNGVYSKETSGALVALTAYIERLSHDRKKS
ncbi:MAG: MobB mobilization protein [Alphaproteobacteria bacterium]